MLSNGDQSKSFELEPFSHQSNNPYKRQILISCSGLQYNLCSAYKRTNWMTKMARDAGQWLQSGSQEFEFFLTQENLSTGLLLVSFTFYILYNILGSWNNYVYIVDSFAFSGGQGCFLTLLVSAGMQEYDGNGIRLQFCTKQFLWPSASYSNYFCAWEFGTSKAMKKNMHPKNDITLLGPNFLACKFQLHLFDCLQTI